MRIYEAGPGRGKTTQLLRWFQERDDRVILVATIREKDLILDILPFTKFNEYEPRIIPMRDRVKLKGMSEVQIGVDNLDWVIGQLLGVDVKYATITRDPSR